MDALASLLSGSPALTIVVSGLLGLLIGSFLNVVIHRLPKMLERDWRAQCAELDGRAAEVLPKYNLLTPRSACPGCQAPIRAWQNVPIISWLLLRGRCAGCNRPIGARYPLVEALTGLCFAAVAWRFGFGWPLAAGLVLTAFLIALTFIDVDTQLLPDDLTLPLLWLGIAVALFLPRADGGRLPVDLHDALIGAMAGYLSLWSVYQLFRLVTGKEGMGYGDFKLLAALGAWLGWQMLLPIILGAAGVGAVLGIGLIVTGQRNRGIPMAFGPYLAAAGWLALLFGPELVSRYLALYARP